MLRVAGIGYIWYTSFFFLCWGFPLSSKNVCTVHCTVHHLYLSTEPLTIQFTVHHNNCTKMLKWWLILSGTLPFQPSIHWTEHYTVYSSLHFTAYCTVLYSTQTSKWLMELSYLLRNAFLPASCMWYWTICCKL